MRIQVRIGYITYVVGLVVLANDRTELALML